MYSQYKYWWLVLLTCSIIIAVYKEPAANIPRVLGVTSGMLLFPILLVAIPAGIQKLISKQLTSAQLMYMYTAAWLLVAIANLS